MAVTLNLTPATDPAYLAFLRSQGLSESDAVGEAQARISRLTRGFNRRLPGYDQQQERGAEDIGANYENRGLYRSGAQLVAQQRLTNDIGQNRLEDQTTTADNIADANSGLARTVAGIRRSTAEQGLNTRERL